jgi:putative transposase
MHAVGEAAGELGGVRPACEALGASRATYYRHREPAGRLPRQRPRPPRALSDAERQHVLDELNSERFVDQPPAQVHAALLDESIYLCSPRTMYRILEQNDQVKERRNQLRHPQYSKPELLATAPNQVWSWDITKLLGPQKWTYFYLYVILDIFSRYVVGWLLAHCESSALAKRLIADSCAKQGVQPGQLTVHADRGTSMKSKTVAQLLADLGVTKTHSRPHVSNDNPFSESQFKTMKYRPDFPDRFGSHSDGLAFCRPFFSWYNTEHHHSGLAFLTPAQVHYGHAERILRERQAVLTRAYQQHPERFPRGAPRVASLPSAVWINPPATVEQNLPEAQQLDLGPPPSGVITKSITRAHLEPLTEAISLSL